MVYDAKIEERRQTNYIVIHSSGTSADEDIGAANLNTKHISLGRKCLGYHFVIRRDGTVEQGRPIKQIGFHCRGYNSDSIGICLIGGGSSNFIENAVNNFTETQLKNLWEVVLHCCTQFDYPKIMGHRDMYGHQQKACPGFNVREWVLSHKKEMLNNANIQTEL